MNLYCNMIGFTVAQSQGAVQDPDGDRIIEWRTPGNGYRSAGCQPHRPESPTQFTRDINFIYCTHLIWLHISQ